MKTRLRIGKVQPAAYEAMDALDNYVSESSIDKIHSEMIRVRASQINGCAYCVDAHSRDALTAGIPLQKLLLISAWKESGAIFTDEERLIIQMTEEITLIHQQGLSDDAYDLALTLFGEQKTAEIIMAIIAINSWNRIGVATHLKPAKE